MTQFALGDQTAHLRTPPTLRARANVRLQFAQQDAKAGQTLMEQCNLLAAARLEREAIEIEQRGMVR